MAKTAVFPYFVKPLAYPDLATLALARVQTKWTHRAHVGEEHRLDAASHSKSCSNNTRGPSQGSKGGGGLRRAVQGPRRNGESSSPESGWGCQSGSAWFGTPVPGHWELDTSFLITVICQNMYHPTQKCCTMPTCVFCIHTQCKHTRIINVCVSYKDRDREVDWRSGDRDNVFLDTFLKSLLDSVCVLSRSIMPFATLWTVACQAPVHGMFQARTLEWVAISLLQGLFLTQGSKLQVLRLLHCRQILYLLRHRGCLAKALLYNRNLLHSWWMNVFKNPWFVSVCVYVWERMRTCFYVVITVTQGTIPHLI